MKKVTWNQVCQIWCCYVVYIKDSAIGNNHLKNLKLVFEKISKMFSFNSLIPEVFSAVKTSIFQDSFCCNFLIRFDDIAFRGVFKQQTSMVKPFGKLFKFFYPWTIFAKNSVLDIWQGPQYVSEYIYSNVIKKTFHAKAVFVSNLIIKISGYI